ncbi:hypothetical protein [Halalkalibacter hemicellulosilyticus]|uniref:Uncharacterized protein n=1 Tax=Halalkalibacter hemicellulosilyticusJCM 9152 TaxID=1236971 RepID=W4QNA6_9BACI|nr:hypothetical protein [Halalkalibacter hemicellulosilyticus]GAE32829.1 hypothetical protein JCM9152_4411 [Halalkalibacter hemicellulosilyticusJCM 9152]
MRRKRWVAILLVVILMLFPFLSYADIGEDEQSDHSTSVHASGTGVSNGKDEVIYANLNATGMLENVYVVNIFDVIEAGVIHDYGNYERVKNLTDLSDLSFKDQKVEFTADEGSFYYQGYLQDTPLPWNVSVSYLLNGESVTADQLAGGEGELRIQIETSANEQVDSLFYENYLLQVTITFDSDLAKVTEAEGATVANAGKNQQLTFTVMPEQDADLTVMADVNDFEMDGIEIAAIPPSMAIDVPDNELTDEMRTLSDAIEELNNGVADLRAGASELHEGTTSLEDGSSQFHGGINEVSEASDDLLEASATIHSSLQQISRALNESSFDGDLDGVTELSEGLKQIGEGLDEGAEGLTQLHENYQRILATLDEVISEIPDHAISEEDIAKLYESGADVEVVTKLVESYSASLTVKGTYHAVNEGLRAVDDNLPLMSSSLTEMATALTTISNGLSSSLSDFEQLEALDELVTGLNEMASQYGEFHNGLVSYMDGIGELAHSYSDLHEGIGELADGTAEFERGVRELEEGTEELYEATSDLPEQMEDEINEMIGEYDKSDLDVVSFVSEQNEHVDSVQFIMQTASISLEEEELVEEEEQEEGFWSRFIRLFVS